jgi:hypothetical protein
VKRKRKAWLETEVEGGVIVIVELLPTGSLLIRRKRQRKGYAFTIAELWRTAQGRLML